MQHVLGCWERQSDGSEYKKTLRQPGLRPGPRCAEGAYSALANPLVGGEGLAVPSPRTPSHPSLSALRASPLLPPTPKLVPTPLLACSLHVVKHKNVILLARGRHKSRYSCPCYAALLPRRGPHYASHSVCPSVCLSVPLSLPPGQL